MEFLYFPEDKSEYIPGIISVIVIFILSMLIIWLLVKASKKQVKQMGEQEYYIDYDTKNSEDLLSIDSTPGKDEVEHTSDNKNDKKES